MYEDRTFNNLMAEALKQAEDEGADTRKNSIIYDALSSACLKLEKYYIDLKHSFDLVFITTAVDDYLDRKGTEYRVFRNPATAACYQYIWEGAIAPAIGERFFTNGLYFMLRRNENRVLYLEAETLGIACNNILRGTSAVPMNNIAGLALSEFGELLEPGADREGNESYRARIQEKIAGPAENGNRQHYKTWCESVPGVGRARIIPLFAGANTVMAVLINTEGLPASQAVVDRVQEYIDPITLGHTVEVGGEVIPVGDGLGDGVANIGAHFAAVTPAVVSINISFDADIQANVGEEEIKAETRATLDKHIRELNLSTPDTQDVVIRMSAVSSILYALPGLVDYANLMINGETANVAVMKRAIAVLGEVSVNVVI